MAGKKAQSQGVGESKINAAPEGSFEREVDWASMTVNGEPIPEHLWGVMPWTYTDQGRAEFNAGKAPASGIQVLRDETDHAVRQFRDDRLSDIPGDAQLERERVTPERIAEIRAKFGGRATADRLGIIMNQHLPKGRRGRWMSQRVCDHEGQGLRRGVLDWEPLLVEKDGKMERVTLGNMFLASVPEKLAIEQDIYYEDLARQKMVAAVERSRELADEIAPARKQRETMRRDFTEDTAGLVDDDPEMAVGQLQREFAG